MNGKYWILALALFALAVVVLFAYSNSTFPTVQAVDEGACQPQSPTIVPTEGGTTVIRFADCMADGATGDLYLTPNPWCERGFELVAVPVVERKVKHHDAPAVVDVPMVEPEPMLVPVVVEPVQEKGNNGHGNNVDGIDSSNPGHGPKNEDGADPSAPVDDEKGKPNKSSTMVLFIVWAYRAVQRGLYRRTKLFEIAGPSAEEVLAACHRVGWQEVYVDLPSRINF
jgi:hypothetical protein